MKQVQPVKQRQEWTGLKDDSSEETRLRYHWSSEVGGMPLAKKEFEWVRACMHCNRF